MLFLGLSFQRTSCELFNGPGYLGPPAEYSDMLLQFKRMTGAAFLVAAVSDVVLLWEEVLSLVCGAKHSKQP